MLKKWERKALHSDFTLPNGSLTWLIPQTPKKWDKNKGGAVSSES